MEVKLLILGLPFQISRQVTFLHLGKSEILEVLILLWTSSEGRFAFDLDSPRR